MIKNFLVSLKGLSAFCSSIIGAGIFLLPYIALKFGFLGTVFSLVLLAILLIFLHWFLAKIVLKTENIQSVPEYTEKYLGSKTRNFSVFISSIGIVGILLVYILLGGKFLAQLFSPYFGGKEIIYTIIIFAFLAILSYWWKPYKRHHIINIGMLIFALIFLAVFFVKALPFISFENLRISNFNFDYAGISVGIIIFALWGLSTVPELKNFVSNNPNIYKNVVRLGIIISAIFYLIFIIIVLGSCGIKTSEESLAGLANVVGGNFIKIGLIFGLLTIIDSFLAFGADLKKIFIRDAGLSKFFSWIFVWFLPLSLFLIGFRDFINIMYLVGGFVFVIEIIILLLVYRKFCKIELNKRLVVPAYFLLFIFFAILIFQFWQFFIK